MRKLIIILLTIIISGNAHAQGLTKELMEQAENGEPIAMTNVGICYKNGLDCEKNYQKMLYWFNKAAEKNEHNAMYNLGCLYDKGVGVKQDYKMAVSWYRKGAERNNLKAMYNLACCLHEGVGTATDNIEAAFWFKKGAVNGDWKSAEKLVLLYSHGDGVPQSKVISNKILSILDLTETEEMMGEMAKLFPDYVIPE